MNTTSLLQEFQAIISEASEQESLKYLAMAKGNLNLALNYYFNAKAKQQKKGSFETNKSAFSELMEGSKNQAKLEKIFNALKHDYSKPIESSIPANFSEKDRLASQELKKTKTLDLNVGGFQGETTKKEEKKSYLEKTEPKRGYEEREVETKDGKPRKSFLMQTVENMMKSETSMVNNVKELPKRMSEETVMIPRKSNENNKLKQTFFPLKRNYTQLERNDQETEIGSYSVSETKNKIIGAFPKYIGKAIIKGYTLRSFNLSHLKRGDEFYLKREKKMLLEEKIPKKKTKPITNKGINDNIIRILTPNQEIGKLENQYAEILAPLLDENFIVIEAFLVQIPPLVETFTPILLEIKVYLMEKTITKPITRIIDKGKLNEFDAESRVLSYFDKTKKNFAGLFELLRLKKNNETLIKLPNKKTVDQLDESSLGLDYSKKTSLNKIDVHNPYQKLPKQASLFDFATSTTNASAKPNSNENQEIKSGESPNKDLEDIDYEHLFKIDTDTHENLDMQEPPNTFKSTLHPYQKQALFWMLKREGICEETKENSQSHEDKLRTLHPLWEEFELEDRFKLYFNPYSGQISAEIPLANSDCKGGILADEMGLGKTVMMLSLLHSNRPQEQPQDGIFPLKKRNKSLGGTLIIVPLTLLSQWEEEIQTHSIPGTFKYCLYYNDNRPQNLYDYDLVITTYGIVSSEFASSKKELFSFEWFRVVLDEAHYIKGRTIQIAKAVYNLKAEHRWCMTGTPIQNKLDDLFSLIHFLRLEPWSDYLWWNSYINKPHEKKDPLVFQIIQTIIAPILLRRTKKGKTKDGRSIIDLPEKETMIEWVTFSREEDNLYQEVYRKSKKEFDDLLSKGAFLSNYMHVFDILTRLRQICDHPYLMLTRSDYVNKEKLEETLRRFVEKRLASRIPKTVEGEEQKDQEKLGHFEIFYDEVSNQELVVNMNKKAEHTFNEKFFNEVVGQLKNNEVENCAVCLGDLEDSVITLCLHITCRLCLVRSLETSGMCPLCRKIITKEDYMTVPRDNKFDIDLDSKFKRSSKLQFLMERVQNLLRTEEKVVIFSQFLGFMDLIEYDFKRNNIQYVRLDGSLNQKKRSEVLKQFKENPKIQIIMISLKAGGVGLNLTEANHVFLLDPWWNPAVEEQAVERVHRIGQKKKVNVVRFICKGSIEERMIEMHKNKKELFNAAICSGEGGVKQEKKMQNVEYFKYLMKHF